MSFTSIPVRIKTKTYIISYTSTYSKIALYCNVMLYWEEGGGTEGVLKTMYVPTPVILSTQNESRNSEHGREKSEELVNVSTTMKWHAKKYMTGIRKRNGDSQQNVRLIKKHNMTDQTSLSGECQLQKMTHSASKSKGKKMIIIMTLQQGKFTNWAEEWCAWYKWKGN